MAGHSKWANIQHRKGRQDAKRGKLFTKLINEITVAVRLGGDDPDTNPRFRAAIDNALANNMPKDTIVRATKRGAGGDAAANLEEIRYEGYGPGSIAVIVDCMTDNRNRMAAEVRHVFSKFGGNLGSSGSVAYLFNKIGRLAYADPADENELMEAAIEAGAQDLITNDDGSIDVITAADDLIEVKTALVGGGFQAEYAQIEMQADVLIELDSDGARVLLKMVDTLEDLDNVQQVYCNARIPAAALAE